MKVAAQKNQDSQTTGEEWQQWKPPQQHLHPELKSFSKVFELVDMVDTLSIKVMNFSMSHLLKTSLFAIFSFTFANFFGHDAIRSTKFPSKYLGMRIEEASWRTPQIKVLKK